MDSIYFEISGGGVEIGVTVIEVDGDLKFELVVIDSSMGGSGTIGDLNGLFFDFGDEALLGGLSITGDDVTGEVFDANSVTKVDGYNNVNGEIAKEYDKFDVGVQFGTSGMAGDDIQSTSFTLTHDTADLTLDMILSSDFAARLTSVGQEDGARNDSLKIGGTAPDSPTDDDGPNDDDPVDDGPTDDDPVDDGPTDDDPVDDGPTDDDPVDDGPTDDEPVDDEFVFLPSEEETLDDVIVLVPETIDPVQDPEQDEGNVPDPAMDDVVLAANDPMLDLG